nr:ribonuclease H-like domain-containing protein [Tanacetum cinerariifolium]
MYNRENTHRPGGNQRNWNNMMPQVLRSNFKIFNKACYVCRSFDHLQADCHYHKKQFKNQRMVKPVWNNAKRVNHNFFDKKTHLYAKKNIVLKGVLIKSGLVSVNTARQVNAAHPKTTVNVARSMSYLFKTAHSTVKRPIHKNTTFKNSNVNQRVNTVLGKNVNTARPNVVVNVVKGNNLNAGNPQIDLQNQKVIDSGCSRHMKWNMSYLINYKEIDGGYVAFGGNPKGGKIIGKDTIKTEAVNTACYVQNRVLVVKPHNKTTYELFHGRTPTLNFMRPFGCPVTIPNTKDHLGKFDGKADEGFFVRYTLNSKAFRVFNSITKIVEENLDIRFSKSSPNVIGSGPYWLFDIDALIRTMNYEPIVAGTQSNGFAGTKASDNADLKSYQADGFKPLSDDKKKVDEDPRKENECNDQEKEDNANSTNNVSTVSSTVNTVGTNEDNELPIDLNMPALEDVSIFNFLNDDEDNDSVADMNNMDTTI